MQQENQQQPQSQTVPPGYWRDAEGRLVPEELIKEIDKCRHEGTHTEFHQAPGGCQCLISDSSQCRVPRHVLPGRAGGQPGQDAN